MKHLSLISIDAIWRQNLVVFVDEEHSKLPMLYWLHKLIKRPHKSRFIANSSSCTTTEFSTFGFLPTAIKTHVIKYCTTVYERYGKN